MTFLSSIWLTLLLPLGLSLWIWRPPTRFLFFTRLASLALVILSLAGLSIRLPSRNGTVVVVADRSLSMPIESAKLQKEAVDLIHRGMTGDDQLAVVSFAQQVAIEKAPGSNKFDDFVQQVGGNASNLGDAIQTALSLIPAGAPGRVLVLSDGKWTGRDPLLMTSASVARNVAIDYRAMERSSAGDLAVARVDAPSTISAGESYLLTGWVFSPVPQEVEYELKQRDKVISRGKRLLNSGMNRLSFRDRATQLGNLAYTLSVFPVTTAEPDPVPENNQARFLVGVSGPRPLLHVTTSDNSGLARLLQRGGLDVRSFKPDAVRWTIEDLSRYSAVILENLPAERIGHVGMETLATWVRETGAGLMMTGGRSSYGPGGYYKSPLEPILPVSMELRNEHRKLALAIMVALDRSGSMAVPVAGGKVKMDLANLGTAAVLDVLGPMDEFGCIAVDSSVHRVVPMGKIDESNKVMNRNKILGIQSMGGGIYVYEALAASAEMLMKARAGTKHIILFSDAQDSEQPGAYRELLANCQKAGITVSVIGLGKESDVDGELLKDIARLGKGRVFFTDNAEELPRLFAQDTFVVARNTFIDEPVRVQHVPGLSTVIDQTLPSPSTLGVGGYNLCYLRPGATLGTVTLDEYKAPLVSTWRAGAGRVVCYTGEADGKYAGAMASYQQVGDYYTSLARWAAGSVNSLRDNMLLTQEVRDGVNVIQLHLDPERKADSFASLPRVTTLRSLPGQAPRTERSTLRWTGADTLTLEVPLDSGEMTLSTIEVPGNETMSMPPVCVPYSPEFKPAQTDRGMQTLEKLGRATGGQERLDLPGIWRDLPRYVRFVPVARWLLLAAVVLWLLEVLERRTSLITSWRMPRRQVEEEREVNPKPIKRTIPAMPKSKRTSASSSPSTSTPKLPASVPMKSSPVQATSTPSELPLDADGIMEALRKARKRAKGRTE